MASQNLVLCIDIGGDSIKIAEFLYPPDGTIVLQRFAYCEYGADKDENDASSLVDALREIILTNGFTAKKVNITLSGQNAFIRFVKVPAMTNDEQKIKEIIEFEAKQTIPFPMNEVVWDSQLIQSEEDNSTEIEAMFVIVKNEEITKITDVMEEMGNEVLLIEVAPTACYNSARANGIGENQCEMVLNIGGRCSTLVFVDGGRFFVRTIPIAGHSVTQQISKEFGISFADAEEMKRRHGFVALGGAYEEPESEVAATVSKIVRNVMTRLHGEINRSINVYRAQQKGRKPEKLYLAGGSSVMAFTPRFFSEKLRIPVEYFNPFQIVTLAPGIDKDSLAEVAHMFSETIGLALRKDNSVCPVQISLIPEFLRKQNALRSKLPYFYASAAALLLCLGVTFWGFSKQVSSMDTKLGEVERFVHQRKQMARQVSDAYAEFQSASREYEQTLSLLKNRGDWVTVFNELQKVVPDNVWFEKIYLQANAGDAPIASRRDIPEEPEEIAPRNFWGRPVKSGTSSVSSLTPSATAKPELQYLALEGSAVSLKKERTSSDESIMSFMTNIEQSAFFEGDINKISFKITADNPKVNLTSFKIVVRLKNPVNKQSNDKEDKKR